jgi:hypothetical protein
MDTTFINSLLLFCILVILVIYLYQATPTLWNTSSNKHSNTTKGEAFLPVIFDTCPNKRVSRMPVHRVGPVYNFHQHFNKYSPLITCSKNPASIPEVDIQCTTSYPTGIPEMGWRNFYLSNYSKYQVPDQDPFAGTSIRNYLNNMENVDNIYRKC